MGVAPYVEDACKDSKDKQEGCQDQKPNRKRNFLKTAYRAEDTNTEYEEGNNNAEHQNIA